MPSLVSEPSEPFYVDGDFSVAEPSGLPVFSSPVRSTSAEYVFSQEFIQERKSFAALPLNTPYNYGSAYSPDAALYVLVSEGPRQDIGGGLIKWSRTYARVPETHDEFETHQYPFIGFVGEALIGNIATAVLATGRPRIARTVTSRVQHDYFLCGPAPAPYTDPGKIPIIQAQRYFAGINPIASEALDADFIMDVVGLIPATSPSRTLYNTWIAAAALSGFASAVIVNNSAGGQLVAEDSRLSRWLGGIWLRQTRYVLAV